MSNFKEKVASLRLRLKQFPQELKSSDEQSLDQNPCNLNAFPPSLVKEKEQKKKETHDEQKLSSFPIETDQKAETESVDEKHTSTDSDDDDEISTCDATETSIMAIHRQKYALNKTKPVIYHQNKWSKPPSVDSGKGCSISQTPQSVSVNVNDIPSTSYSRQSAFNCEEAGKTFVPFSQQKQDWPALVVTGKTFRILNLIGKGGSSSVYHVYDEGSKNCYAIKCVDLSDTEEIVKKAYANEIMLLEKLQHSNRVVKMFAYEFAPEKNMLYVLMEKGDTDLATLFKSRKEERLSEITIAYFWIEMLKAVQVVHQQGIVHSDLKPANFLLVAGHLKLIDFGIANAVPANKTSITKESHMGTLNYMSPEAMSNAGGPYEYKFKVGVKSDVWSLGCILYNMVYGRTPFQHIGNPAGKLMAITNPKYPIEFPPISDHLLLDVMKKCLQREPKNRPSIEQLLQHPYNINKPSNETSLTTNESGKANEAILLELATVISQNTPKTGARILKTALSELQLKKRDLKF